MNTRTTIALSALAGAALILTVAAATAPDTTPDETVTAPVSAPVETPAPVATPPVVESTPDAGIVNEDPAVEEAGEPPAPDSNGVQHFEDGSWLAADGTQGCDPGTPCDQLPPIPDTAVPSGNGGYLPDMVLPPCDVEDAEYNCYWDATRQGNGIGHSFIVWDGAVYYAG